MSEQDNVKKEDQPALPRPAGDWLLENLVVLANDLNAEFGVTLLVGGAIVTGMIVSGRAYFDGFAQEISETYSDPEVSKAVKESYLKHKQLYPERAADDDSPSQPANYIHLRDARFIANGQKPIPNNRGVWWRARLSCVDAFNVGTMS